MLFLSVLATGLSKWWDGPEVPGGWCDLCGSRLERMDKRPVVTLIDAEWCRLSVTMANNPARCFSQHIIGWHLFFLRISDLAGEQANQQTWGGM